MHRRIGLLVSGLFLVVSCTTGQAVDSIALTSELSDIAADANTALFRLFSTLDQPYEDIDLLYQRITDLGLPTTFAIGIDKAQRVTPPPGSKPEHERFLDLLADLLFALGVVHRAHPLPGTRPVRPRHPGRL
jgi:hypothetical protein